MLYIVNKIIFSLCLFYVIGKSKCEAQEKQLGVISLDDVAQKQPTNWQKVAPPREDSYETTTYEPIENECGGYIEARLDHKIILEYKPNEEYNNDEFCVWVVRNRDCLSILFTKTKSGFEFEQDYLQISTFYETHQPPTIDLLGNTTGIEQVNGVGKGVSLVIFASDSSNKGTGFRLEIVGYTERTYPVVYDDYFSTSTIGSIKLRPYFLGMIQLYLILPPHGVVPSLALDVEYVTNFFHYLSVFSMERNASSINFHRHAVILSETGSKSFEEVYHSNFIVFFNSDFGQIPENGGYTLDWYVPHQGSTPESFS